MKPSRVTLRIRLGSRAREAAASPLIWRYTHGHRGGYYVDVPAQNFQKFKERFPRGTFPRRIQEKSVAESIGNDDTEIRFDSIYTRSRGRYHQVFFANRTLGEHILTEGRMLQDETAEKPNYND